MLEIILCIFFGIPVGLLLIALGWAVLCYIGKAILSLVLVPYAILKTCVEMVKEIKDVRIDFKHFDFWNILRVIGMSIFVVFWFFVFAIILAWILLLIFI